MSRGPRLSRALATLAVLLLAGCTSPEAAPQESSEDEIEPPGVAISTTNDADAPITASYRVRGLSGAVMSEAERLVPPGGEVEVRLRTAPSRDHTVELVWNWTANGRASSGATEIVVDPADCAASFTSVAFRFEGDTASGIGAGATSSGCVD